MTDGQFYPCDAQSLQLQCQSVVYFLRGVKPKWPYAINSTPCVACRLSCFSGRWSIPRIRPRLGWISLVPAISKHLTLSIHSPKNLSIPWRTNQWLRREAKLVFTYPFQMAQTLAGPSPLLGPQSQPRLGSRALTTFWKWSWFSVYLLAQCDLKHCQQDVYQCVSLWRYKWLASSNRGKLMEKMEIRVVLP